MPATTLMSWEGKGNRRRWWKQYKGKRYVVGCKQLGLPPGRWNKEGSYQVVNKWWEAKQREVDGLVPEPDLRDLWIPGKRAPELREQIIARARQEGHEALAPAAEGRLKTDHNGMPIDYDPDDFAPSPATDRTVGAHVRSWLDEQWAGVADGDITEGEAKARTFYIAKFRDWVGAERDVAEITTERWRKYYTYLKGEDLVGKWSKSYRKKLHRTARDFVGDLVRNGAIPPIIDLVSRKDKFTIKVKEVDPFTTEELRRLLSAADERLRLDVLLGLNIGATQVDVSELKHPEIDWEGGWIERKRTKTEEEENVPKVCYKAWPETMELLRKFRSDDPERALLSPTGKPLVRRGRVTSDAVRTRFERLAKKLGIKKSFKYLRKTGSTRIKKHSRSDELTRWYLGHGDPTMRKHYVKEDFAPLWPELDWLREDLEIDRLGSRP